MKRTAASIQADIAKGAFRPHTALSNMALAYYQNDAKSFAKSIFPICPVTLSSDNYYVFSKEDLLRDNWHRKPAYGKVDPAVLSEQMETYACQVDQMIMGIDQIRQTDLTRRMGPRTADPRQQRTKAMAGQANIHQDSIFASKFFKSGVWNQEYKQDKSEVGICTMDIAEMFGWAHTKVFNMVSKYVTVNAEEQEKKEFHFAERIYKQGVRKHAVCYLTEKGGQIFLDKPLYGACAIKGENSMKSENTKTMTATEIEKIQKEVENMDDDALAAFRNQFEEDTMGFCGEEGAIE